MTYINTYQLYKCDSCAHYVNGGCMEWCDHGECYKPDIHKLAFEDVASVKYSEWEISCDGYYPYCKRCGYEPPYASGRDMRTQYCPECGAKMKGGKG